MVCEVRYILSGKQQLGWSEKYGVIYTPLISNIHWETAQFQLSLHIAELDQIVCAA